MIANLDAAVKFLKARKDVSGKVAAIGWCYGGGVALSFGLDGANHEGTAMFYGRLVDDPEKLKHLHHELYGTFAGLDQNDQAATTWTAFRRGAARRRNQERRARLRRREARLLAVRRPRPERESRARARCVAAPEGVSRADAAMTQRRRNVLLITADQWRGDCLSAVGHPVVRSPNLDALAAEGVLFERHFANAVPCGPSRACLHTGMYLHNHRSGTNGTPLDRRFTNWALEVRRAGLRSGAVRLHAHGAGSALLTPDDPRLGTDEGILPGITPVVDMATHCGPWREWLKQFGYRVAGRSRRDVWPARGGSPRRRRAAAVAVRAESHRHVVPRAERDGLHRRKRGTRASEPGWAVHLSVRAPHPPWVAARAVQRALSAAARCRDRVRRNDVEAEGALHPWLAAHLHAERNASHTDDLRHRHAAGELLRPDGRGGRQHGPPVRAPQSAGSSGTTR